MAINKDDRTYSVRCDGNEIVRVVLSFEEYKDQTARDKIRKAIASHYNVPSTYLRLTWLDRRYLWDEDQQRNIFLKDLNK